MLASSYLDKIVVNEVTVINRDSFERGLFFLSVSAVVCLSLIAAWQFVPKGNLGSTQAPTNFAVTNLTDVSSTLGWETSYPTSGYVVYGTSPENLNLKAFDNNAAADPEHFKTTRHLVTLTNLQPNTYYYFALVVEGENTQIVEGKTLLPLKTALKSFLTDPNLQKFTLRD
jgi:hypothetical protein